MDFKDRLSEVLNEGKKFKPQPGKKIVVDFTDNKGKKTTLDFNELEEKKDKKWINSLLQHGDNQDEAGVYKLRYEKFKD